MAELTKEERKALALVKERKFCAYWLIDRSVLKSLLLKRLIVPAGFYSVALPGTQKWTLVSYAEPEKAFDQHFAERDKAERRRRKK